MEQLRAQLLADRLASFQRLKGGFPIPLAGAVYWGVLAWAGYTMPLRSWLLLAMWGSGMIFPVALLFARLFRNEFMKDRTAAGDVLVPTFASMLLFWPILVAALWTSAELAPLILAIGMSIHWPVIGWSYGKTTLYTAHAVVRAAVVFAIWVWMPGARLTLLPLSVSIVYLLSVAAILAEVSRMRRRESGSGGTPQRPGTRDAVRAQDDLVSHRHVSDSTTNSTPSAAALKARV